MVFIFKINQQKQKKKLKQKKQNKNKNIRKFIIKDFYFFIKFTNKLMYYQQNIVNMQKTDENDKQFGFNVKWLPIFNVIQIIFAIGVGYAIAVYQGDTPAYPATDITHTTIYYPEYYFARIGFPMCCVILSIMWFAMVFFLNSVAARANIVINYQNQQLQIQNQNIMYQKVKLITIPYKFMLIFGVAGCILFLLSICVISDGGRYPDGYLNMHLHLVGASGFFICTYLVILTCSWQYMKIWKVIPNFVNRYSYLYKVVFFYGVIILLLIDGILSLWNPELLDLILPKYSGNIIEWWGTLIMLIYFFTFTYDLKNVSLNLETQSY